MPWYRWVAMGLGSSGFAKSSLKNPVPPSLPAQLQADGLWAAWVDVAFARLDANGDGEISLDEILAHLPLLSTDPDDDVASERLLEVTKPSTLSLNNPELAHCALLSTPHFCPPLALLLLCWLGRDSPNFCSLPEYITRTSVVDRRSGGFQVHCSQPMV